MRFLPTPVLRAFLSVAMTGAVNDASAATLYRNSAGPWDGITGNWTTSGGAATVWSAANVASFGGTGGGVEVAAGISAQRLQFTAAGYTLSGGTLALTSGSNSAGTETFNVASGIRAVVQSDLTSSLAEVWLRGGGTLVLAGANTLNGSLVINGGSTLEISNIAALGTSNSSGLAFNGTGNTFRYTGPSATLPRLAPVWGLTNALCTFEVTDPATTMTVPQALANNSGTSSFAKTGPGTLMLTGATTFNGGLSVSAGTLGIGGADGAIASQPVTLGAGTSSGRLVLGDAAAAKNITIGNLATSGTGTANAVTGGNSATSTLTVNTTTFGNFTGSLGGTGSNENNLSLVKSGAGTLTLEGASTLAGRIVLNAGFLGIRYGTELGSPSSPVPDQLTINGGTLMNMTNATSATAFASGWSPTLGPNAGITLGAAGGTFRIGYGSGKILTVSGPVSGSGTLTKVDSGTLVLAGTNTHAGNTAVNAGLLQLAATGSLRFTVTNASCNAITGTGQVVLLGGFDIDTGAVTLSSGSWTLVNTSTLTESYGTTFRPLGAGWFRDGTVWYRHDGGKLWTFSQTTGALTLAAGGSFPHWIAGYSFASQAAPDISVTGDPDGDGIPNGVEHVFGTAPDEAGPVGESAHITGGTLVWTHPLSSAIAPDVTWSYQWSADLVEWRAGGEPNISGTVATITPGTPQNGNIAVSAAITQGATDRLFLRIAASSSTSQPLSAGCYFPKKIYVPEALPAYAAAQELLPEPVLPTRPDLQQMYWKCWQLAFSHLKQPQTGSPLVSNWLDEAFSANIFQWDTCFMMMFARYGHYQFPAIQSLDNFYALQRPSGYICRELAEADGAEIHWGSAGNSPDGWKNTINPPIFAWAETETYKVTGDKSRFASVLPVLEHYVAWLNRPGTPADTDMDLSGRRSAGTPHELYWNTGLGCGMDNTPKPAATGAGWVDMSSQMVMQYHDLATICRELGQTTKANAAEAEATAIAARINQWCWDEQDGFYYDVDATGTRFKKKTASGFWPLVAGIASPAQAARLVAHLQDPAEFWRPFVFPTLAANEPEYRADGGYWLGGVWAPTNYMIIKGLERYGYDSLAAEASQKYIDAMSAVFQSTGTVWENYAPESMSKGNPAAGDFVGWTGCGPIALYIENVLGFRPSGATNTLRWNLRLAEPHGINRLRFGSTTCDILHDGTSTATITASDPFTLVVNGVTHAIPAGQSQIQCAP